VIVEQEQERAPRDLADGIPATELAEGSIIDGTLNGERIIVARSDGTAFAIGGLCTHYGSPLAGGIVVDGGVRCPLHHACFDLHSGAATCAPAMSPVPTYDVTETDGKICVGAARAADNAIAASLSSTARRTPAGASDRVRTIVILGTGAAGTAAAASLRTAGFDGRVVMVGAEDELPYDRPNLSKDYLAGTAGDEWLPIKPREFYRDNEIELMLGHRVSAIDTETRELRTLKGRSPIYDRLLIATGSAAVGLPVATHTLRHVHTLRTLADARAIIAATHHAKRAVVVGGSFIGLEVAASLRARGLAVDLVAPSGLGFDRIFGPTLSAFVQRLHESHGVTFHLRTSVAAIDETHVTLVGGKRLPADLVVVGIGVRPSVAVAKWAQLEISDGIVVDEFLQTSRRGIFAAGDVARWRDRRTGADARVEHWNVALRHGQTAARNMLGERVPFDTVPFFWSQHYDVAIKYVGQQGTWDELSIDGDPDARDCAVEYRSGGKVIAVATIGRDVANLEAELAFERGETPAVIGAAAAR
jgi:NADPH-dependent 2,4-dienoyl-CoA reductase/sulfur reductase-like enzyme/nitrite reductase/ring-hydroxylating ferredoxin subunit